MHKVGRNDPCPCGSGKKFKKCCETKNQHCRFQATVLSSDPQSKTERLSARFFHGPLSTTDQNPPQDL